MIKKDHCMLLGTFSKPHGIKGSLLLWYKNLKTEDIRQKESVFVDIDGLLVPFFIENFQKNSPETAILKLTGINSETKAKKFAGGDVYVLNEQVRIKAKSMDEMPSISGYKVTDIRLGYIGIAAEIADIAKNPLLRVKHDKKEFLIPVHEDIILAIDDVKMEITIDAPEGLFDL